MHNSGALQDKSCTIWRILLVVDFVFISVFHNKAFPHVHLLYKSLTSSQ